MDVTELSREKISRQLTDTEYGTETARIIFAPEKITDKNLEEICRLYTRVDETTDTVVVIESRPGSASKKLPMPSFKSITTSLGEVMANDRLRNDFADEDDDFFINDEAYEENLGLHHHLMLMQCRLKDFTILSIQITDESPSIIRELAQALNEIMASKNALVVFCCELETSHQETFGKIQSLIQEKNIQGLMNYLYSQEAFLAGTGAFLAGVMLAAEWELSLHFGPGQASGFHHYNLLNGYAAFQHQTVRG